MSSSPTLSEFQTIIRRLRSDNGCPWDRKQSPETLRKYLLEETEELAEAIDENDPDHICEEIGDVLFILCLLAEIFDEQGLFSIQDCIRAIHSKMIRRHPHVFGDVPIGDLEEQRRRWQAIKEQEGKSR